MFSPLNETHQRRVNLFFMRTLMYSPLTAHVVIGNKVQIYLKSFFIQDPGAKDGYAIGGNASMLTSAQGFG